MADAHAKHHDYHLVDPSPWPIVGSVAALVLAVGLISWMHKMYRGGAGRIRGRRDRRALHDVRVVARRHQRSRAQGRSHPRGADLAPLRHDPVHRLGSDVLRRLVLGLFLQRAVSGRCGSRRAHRAVRRRVAAEGHRDLRSVAPAAAQHADPAHLRHHGDVGASRAAARRPQGAEVGPDLHHHPRRAVHLRAGLRIRPRGVQVCGPHLRRDLLHGDRLPRRACADRHDLPDRVPGARL